MSPGVIHALGRGPWLPAAPSPNVGTCSALALRPLCRIQSTAPRTRRVLAVSKLRTFQVEFLVTRVVQCRPRLRVLIFDALTRLVNARGAVVHVVLISL
jgi:hypothetical protein